MYARKVQAALKDAVDTRKLAETWAAMHPADFTSKAASPALSAFLARARQAIESALRKVLGDLWPEAWVLGQQAAEALAADVPEADWAGWSPGDVEAAIEAAGDGLRQLLADQDITIKSIADSRLSELGDILAEYLSSDVTERPGLPEPLPPQFSLGQLADALEGVLNNPDRAYMVAQSEVARAQGAAAEWTFGQMGVREEQISTAADTRVCETCMAAEEAGPQPVGTYKLGLHPLCRCAKIPVLEGMSS